LNPPPGAFPPWLVYKYLKVNTPYVSTAQKDIMAGSTLDILNADAPIKASQFQCVQQDNEWKARVRSEFVVNNILTVERDDGMGGNCTWPEHGVDPNPEHRGKFGVDQNGRFGYHPDEHGVPVRDENGQPIPCREPSVQQCTEPDNCKTVLGAFTGRRRGRHIVSRCLLQDISLYRSMGGMLGLRLDYGHCPTGIAGPSKKQAFIMIGLKMVNDPGKPCSAENSGTSFSNALCHNYTGTWQPRVREFFEGICTAEGQEGARAAGILDTLAMELNQNWDASSADPIAGLNKPMCWATSADMEDMLPLDPLDNPPCFDEGIAYTLLDHNNKFPTIPVPESDYKALLAKLPVGVHVADDPCAPVNQAKKDIWPCCRGPCLCPLL